MTYPPTNKYGLYHLEQMTVVQLEKVIARIVHGDTQLHIHKDCFKFIYGYITQEESMKVSWVPEGYFLYSPFTW